MNKSPDPSPGYDPWRAQREPLDKGLLLAILRAYQSYICTRGWEPKSWLRETYSKSKDPPSPWRGRSQKLAMAPRQSCKLQTERRWTELTICWCLSPHWQGLGDKLHKSESRIQKYIVKKQQNETKTEETTSKKEEALIGSKGAQTEYTIQS